ncbi:MAG: hydrolase [Acidobacteria bacterium]|nr:MAG: hydrolase [Acidobacteriota bacterium]
MKGVVSLFLLAGWVLAGGTVRAAQADSEPVSSRPRPDLQAREAEVAPVLDGDVLGDPAWDGVPFASGFVQTTPDEGAPASQRTEVRIIYDDRFLYVGVICFDDFPSGIIVADSRRDASLDETDSFQVIFDTYHDLQNGFVFGTNPAGQEYDGQLANEGEGGGRGASVGGFNLNWDGSWEVATRRGDFGWSAEFAIPFRTLRFAGGDGLQQWGLNFRRTIRRRNETAFWAPLSRQYGLYRLSQAGTLDDLRIRPPRNLKITPYGLVQARREGTVDAGTDTNVEAGLDLKYSVTPGLTLDVTINTDFAQVEADEQQINLDRFSLFFPEKRPFFLENAGLFSVGEPGEVELFFSRRIGLGPAGEVIPIIGGARLSGKVRKTNIGFLDMATDKVTGVAETENYAVARISRELPHRSAIGFLFTNRQSTGDQPAEDEYGRTFALDGRVGIGQYQRVAGYVARTDNSDGGSNQYSYRTSYTYDSGEWLLNAGYTEVGEGFDPQVGFLRRSAYRKPDALIFRRYRPKNSKHIQELRPHVSYRGFWDFDGFQESGFLHMDNHIEWKKGQEFHTAINLTREGVKEAFEIFPGIMVPPGTYDHSEVALVAFSNRGAPVSFSLNTTVGGFFGGDRINIAPGVRVRFGDNFNTELTWRYNNIDLPEGDFETNLGLWRLSYSFTPRMFLESLVQYNDVDDNLSANLRFGWLQTANVGLFVVYNDIQEIGPLGPPRPDRSLTVKMSWQFDALR